MEYVTDANIWISLIEHGGLLVEVFCLPFRWKTTNFIVSELGENLGPLVTARGLEEIDLSGDEISQVEALSAKYLGPSVADISALVAAKNRGLTLLTGDGSLRKAAESESVSVHGTNWLINQMVLHGIIVPDRADRALDIMRRAGSWLPDQRPWHKKQ